MDDFLLPKRIGKIHVPPIKCQGIKTKLIGFIAENIVWGGSGRWIEPFLGSGVVAFNIAPRKAILSETNKHIIQFYKDIKSGEINEKIVKKYLENTSKKLLTSGEKFYYKIRDKFNTDGGGSLELLFLNRSCFNGVMRFNSKGKFNVPFGHKPNRFRQAYITKIVNQVTWVRKLIEDKDWMFAVSDWKDILSNVQEDDFVYLDPPYIGRHADYYNNWSEEDAIELSKVAKSLPCGFALSMWKENKYRTNEHLEKCWGDTIIRTFDHFYHVGSTESLRNKMIEALAIKPKYATADSIFEKNEKKTSQTQLVI